ncbi:hypothetical protein FOZ62_028983, partial [Perkinsus olseni]
ANDGTQRKLDGQQRLDQAVRNKRKQFLANNHKVATSFDEVIQEVQKQGFVSLDDDAIRAIGDSLRDTPIASRFTSSSPSNDDLYSLGDIQVPIGTSKGPPDGSGRGGPQAMVVLSSGLGLKNIYNSFDPSSPFLVGARREYGVPVMPSISVDGHFKSIRGVGMIATVSILHYTLKSDGEMGWSAAPAITGVGFSESKACIAFLLERLRDIVNVFFGGDEKSRDQCTGPRPSYLVADAAPGIVTGARETFGADLVCIRCEFHASENLSSVSVGSSADKELFLAYAKEKLGRLVECAGWECYECYVKLLLPEVEAEFGEGPRKTLTLSWLTNVGEYGAMYHLAPKDVLRRRILGCTPVTNNCTENGFKTFRVHFLEQQRINSLIGDEGAICVVKKYLRAVGDCAAGSRIAATATGWMRVVAAQIERKAAVRIEEHGHNIRRVLHEMDPTPDGHRMFCVSSSRRTSPLSPQDMQKRVEFDLAPRPEVFRSVKEFEDVVLGIHLVILPGSVAGPPTKPLCTCRGFASCLRCSHTLMVEHVLGRRKLATSIPIPAPSRGRPTRSHNLGPLERHPTDVEAHRKNIDAPKLLSEAALLAAAGSYRSPGDQSTLDWEWTAPLDADTKVAGLHHPTDVAAQREIDDIAELLAEDALQAGEIHPEKPLVPVGKIGPESTVSEEGGKFEAKNEEAEKTEDEKENGFDDGNRRENPSGEECDYENEEVKKRGRSTPDCSPGKDMGSREKKKSREAERRGFESAVPATLLPYSAFFTPKE